MSIQDSASVPESAAGTGLLTAGKLNDPLRALLSIRRRLLLVLRLALTVKTARFLLSAFGMTPLSFLEKGQLRIEGKKLLSEYDPNPRLLSR